MTLQKRLSGQFCNDTQLSASRAPNKTTTVAVLPGVSRNGRREGYCDLRSAAFRAKIERRGWVRAQSGLQDYLNAIIFFVKERVIAFWGLTQFKAMRDHEAGIDLAALDKIRSSKPFQ